MNELLYSGIIELFLYGSAAFLFFRKKELVIIYMPMLFFTRNLVGDPFIRAMLWYLLITGLLVYSAHRLNLIKRINLPAVLLFFYFTILFILSDDMRGTRSNYLAMYSLIGVFCIAPALYAKYGKNVIYENLYKMAGIVLFLFVANCIISSLTGYAPRPFYGQTTGIVYGNMAPTNFMLVPVALFIFLIANIHKVSWFNLTLSFLGFAFVMVSMRRTAALAALVAVGCFLMMLLLEKDKRRFVQLASAVAVIVVIGFLFTDIDEQFSERYESRFEDGTVVSTDEGRFTDHQMVYDDIFVHQRYSAVFGYGFFDSPGNYGGGVHGPSRPLHPDIPVIVHASGVVGLFLYAAMIGLGFLQSWQASRGSRERVLILFCLIIFGIFTFSGRITETSYAMGLFLLLFLPIAGADLVSKRPVVARKAEAPKPEPETVSVQ